MSSSSLRKRSSSAAQDGQEGNISPPPIKRKLTPTTAPATTNSAVANFFKPASQKDPEKVTFQIVHDTLLVARYTENDQPTTTDIKKPAKIAAFDFDSTLITTKSGLKFARGEDDWKWWHASVPTRLKQLHADGYTLIVVSNQGGVSLRPDPKAGAGATRSLKNLKGKIGAVLRALEVPMGLYAATAHDGFRKPRMGMWEQLTKDYSLEGEGSVDYENSVFIGDAAGRGEDKAAKTKKDFSCSDRDFAANVGIGFQTPEEFFLGEDAKPFARSFDPAAYLDTEITSKTDATPIVFTKRNELDLVLFCGSPGSGKSTFFWHHLRPLGYERVNQDTLKTKDKCMKVATQHLEDGTSVVVDNTNADIETRAAWVALAKKLKVPVRLVHFTAGAKLCEHNDAVRALTGDLMNPEKRAMLPKMAFTGFTSRYREPKADEGFQDITKVDFKFEGTTEQQEQWKKYWIS